MRHVPPLICSSSPILGHSLAHGWSREPPLQPGVQLRGARISAGFFQPGGEKVEHFAAGLQVDIDVVRLVCVGGAAEGAGGQDAPPEHLLCEERLERVRRLARCHDSIIHPGAIDRTRPDTTGEKDTECYRGAAGAVGGQTSERCV